MAAAAKGGWQAPQPAAEVHQPPMNPAAERLVAAVEEEDGGGVASRRAVPGAEVAVDGEAGEAGVVVRVVVAERCLAGGL